MPTDFRLSHYSKSPFIFDKQYRYRQDRPRGYGKPAGMWVSVDGEMDWPEWCLSEEFGIQHLATRYRVTLREGHNVMWIGSAGQIEAFHNKFSVESDLSRIYQANDPFAGEFTHNQRVIDWHAVKDAGYDGLIIAPYQWSLRLRGPHWYYGWDCASGCIWNIDAVESFELAPLLALEREG